MTIIRANLVSLARWDEYIMTREGNYG
jgi:hypothetical protein